MNDLDFIRKCLSLAFSDTAEYGTEGVSFPEDWMALFKFCAKQGIMGYVLDGIIRLGDTTCPKDVHKKMVSNTISTEVRFENTLKTAGKLSSFFAQNGIRMVVLKGFSFASFFPTPFRRASTDLDCFLFDDYEKGNRLVEEKGIKIDRSHYKHSNFKINGLLVENHRFCTPVRGNKKTKALEKRLQGLLNEESLTPIMGTDMLCPGPMFNALFYTSHARSHFILEGIALRHILDWAMLRRSLPDNFDRKAFNECLEEFGMKRFSDTVDELTSYMLDESDYLSDIGARVLKDICRNTGTIEYHKGIKTTIQLVRKAFSSGWKYRQFSEESMMSYLMKAWICRMFEKNPKL